MASVREQSQRAWELSEQVLALFHQVCVGEFSEITTCNFAVWVFIATYYIIQCSYSFCQNAQIPNGWLCRTAQLNFCDHCQYAFVHRLQSGFCAVVCSMRIGSEVRCEKIHYSIIIKHWSWLIFYCFIIYRQHFLFFLKILERPMFCHKFFCS